ncbi:unnamed protein product [Somion occarium]|uniref:Uncharacterized protein n=1 Tax=Somion occarium TaxID=3059160 RepID=A0ABP1CYJ1_9APHY
MTSSTRLTTPPGSPERGRAQNEPVTPENNIRNRRRNEGTPMPGEISPSSSTISSGSRAFSSTQSPFSLSTLHSGSTFNLDTPARRIMIRADPTLVTCFDPADKELYDLWAPK